MRDSPLARLSSLVVISGILLLTLIVRAIFAQPPGGPWPGHLHSELAADYSADPEDWQFAPLDPAIVAEAILDELVADNAQGAWVVVPNVAKIIAHPAEPVSSNTPAPGDPQRTPTSRSDSHTPTAPPSPLPSSTSPPATSTDMPSPSPQPTTPSPVAIPSPTPLATSTPPPPPPPPQPLPPPTSTPPPPPQPLPPPPPPQPLPPPLPPPPPATADLSHSLKVASADIVASSDPISYQIKIDNSSPFTATGVEVNDNLPWTFSLEVSSVYGPNSEINPSLFKIKWGPFDVPPLGQVTVGYSGTLRYDPSGKPTKNKVKISAQWLESPLWRSSEVLVVDQPEVGVVSGSLTPTVVLQDQFVDFQLEAYNQGHAWVDLDTTSYLELTNSHTFTTPLTSTLTLPADAVARSLSFELLHLSPVPTGTLQANLHLHGLDENGTEYSKDFADIGQVTVE